MYWNTYTENHKAVTSEDKKDADSYLNSLETELVSNCCSAKVEHSICQKCFDGCEEVETK